MCVQWMLVNPPLGPTKKVADEPKNKYTFLYFKKEFGSCQNWRTNQNPRYRFNPFCILCVNVAFYLAVSCDEVVVCTQRNWL